MNADSPGGPVERIVGRHTPGPWLDWETLKWLREPKHLLAETADARLIAAAPDLLEMLQELRECADYWSEYDVPVGIVERMDAVLAKALGVPPNAALNGGGSNTAENMADSSPPSV